MTFTDDTHCKKGHELVKKGGMFSLREHGLLPGMVCEICNALYDSAEWKEALHKRKEFLKGLEKKMERPWNEQVESVSIWDPAILDGNPVGERTLMQSLKDRLENPWGMRERELLIDVARGLHQVMAAIDKMDEAAKKIIAGEDNGI